MEFIPLVLAGIAVMGLGLGVASWLCGRYATVCLGLNLRNGEKYAGELDALLADSDFQNPSGRLRAITRIAHMIDEAEVVDSFAGNHGGFGSRESEGARAERITRQQMEHVGIEPRAMNVATSSGARVQKPAPESDSDDEEDESAGEACVLTMTITVRRSALSVLAADLGGRDAAVETLRRLARLDHQHIDALYLYYAPNESEPMDPHTANRLFLDLKTTVTR